MCYHILFSFIYSLVLILVDLLEIGILNIVTAV